MILVNYTYKTQYIVSILSVYCQYIVSILSVYCQYIVKNGIYRYLIKADSTQTNESITVDRPTFCFLAPALNLRISLAKSC